MTVGGGQVISDAIRLCSGENVFADLKPLAPKVTVEAVLAADPEAIVEIDQAGDLAIEDHDGGEARQPVLRSARPHPAPHAAPGRRRGAPVRPPGNGAEQALGQEQSRGGLRIRREVEVHVAGGEAAAAVDRLRALARVARRLRDGREVRLGG